MSKLRRGKAASKDRSVQCRVCGKTVQVLDSSKLGYEAAQWQCMQCGRWNRFAAGFGEMTVQGPADGPPKSAALAMARPVGSLKPTATPVFAWE